jgi:hypothetical protein
VTQAEKHHDFTTRLLPALKRIARKRFRKRRDREVGTGRMKEVEAPRATRPRRLGQGCRREAPGRDWRDNSMSLSLRPSTSVKGDGST